MKNLSNFCLFVIDMQEGNEIEESLVESNLNILDFAKENGIATYIFEFKGIEDEGENTINEIKLFAKNFNFQYFIKTTSSCFGDYIFRKEDFEKQRNRFLLENELKACGIENILLAGISKSVCPMYTTEDGIKEGFKIYTTKDLMDLPQFGNKFYRENCQKYLDTHNQLIDYLKK